MAPRMSSERLERVRSLLRDGVERAEWPMASIRVARHGEVLLAEHHTGLGSHPLHISASLYLVLNVSYHLRNSAVDLQELLAQYQDKRW